MLQPIRCLLDRSLCFRPERKLAGSGSHRRINRALQGTHNNPAENSIRPFVVGRKNWLFTASPHGAKASAMLYSPIESTKANGLAPRAYLGFLLERLPTAKTSADIAALLPQNLAADDIWLPPVTL